MEYETFNKLMKSFLQKATVEVEDLFTDLTDAEAVEFAGEKLGLPNSGRTQVHWFQNVNKSLVFLHTDVMLENNVAEDIVDGDQRINNGLFWSVILL